MVIGIERNIPFGGFGRADFSMIVAVSAQEGPHRHRPAAGA
ncbi:hypothetical protein [Streptomyces flaveolus]